MTPGELDSYDADELRALLITAIDDLLRLCAAVTFGDTDPYTAADADVLTTDWAWASGSNSYSDGTVIIARDSTTHLYAPPHRRGDPSDV